MELCNKLTNSIGQSPWEANSYSVKKNPRLLWDPKIHYLVHNGPPLTPILSQMHPIHNSPPPLIFSKSILILPSNLRLCLPSGLFPAFSNQNIVCISHLSYPCNIPRSSHPPWFDKPNRVWWSVEVMELLNLQSSPASNHFLPLTSKYSPQHPGLEHPQSTSMFFP
jgi:hypothetical protein